MDLANFPTWLAPLLVIGCLLAIIFGPTALVSLWERRLVWPYASLEGPTPSPPPRPPAADGLGDFNPFEPPRASKADAPPPMTPQMEKVARQAMQEGFRHVGVFRDGKGKLYNVRYDFWLSADGLVLLLVGGGKMASIPTEGMTLHTLLDDGRCLATVFTLHDEVPNLSGLSKTWLVRSPDLPKLLAIHRKRVDASDVSPRPYSPASPVDDHRAFRVRQTDILEARGLARYLDADRDAWRHTLKGALLVSFRGISTGMRRRFWPDTLFASRRLKPARRRPDIDVQVTPVAETLPIDLG